MDQLLKSSPNKSLLARRKNNTASKMLEERLHNLEEKYHRGYRQFLRERSRVQSEMKDLKDTTSAFDDKTAPDVALKKAQLHSTTREHHPAHMLWHQGFQKLKIQQRMFSVNQNKSNTTTPTFQRTRFHYSGSSPKGMSPHNPQNGDSETLDPTAKERDNELPIEISNTIRLSQGHMPKGHMSQGRMSQGHMPQFDSPASINDTGSHRTAQTIDAEESYLISDHSTKANKKNPGHTLHDPIAEGSSQHSSVPSGNVMCKFSPQPHSRATCHHFPCVTPSTYHTIGRKLTESSPTTYKNSNSVTVRLSFSGPKLHPVTQTSNVSSATASITTSRSDLRSIRAIDKDQTDNSEDRTVISRSGHISNNQLKACADNNPSRKQSDSILERVRNGSLKHDAAVDSGARTSVKAKIRGLNHLSEEMRAKNDRRKPQPWAVNYGQQTPLRVLLNPVLPNNNVA